MVPSPNRLGSSVHVLPLRQTLLDRVTALIADEPLTPAPLYVSVALLSGSILARDRSVFLRILIPPTFFLLKVTQNVSAYAGTLEEEHFPSLVQKHAVAIAHNYMMRERVRAAGIYGRDKDLLEGCLQVLVLIKAVPTPDNLYKLISPEKIFVRTLMTIGIFLHT